MADRHQQAAVKPLIALYSFLQNQTRVRIWLYENPHGFIEGVIVGFDEYMNVVIEDAVEIDTKKKKEAKIGRIMLKGDNITLVTSAVSPDKDKKDKSS